MYKVGDKVEYRGEVVKITQIFYSDSERACMVSNGTLEAYAHLSYLDKHKSAHEKLIEMGYEQKMGGSNLTLYMKGDLTIYVYKKEKCVICHGPNDSQLTFIISLALSRIITQYLEELEDE